MFILGVQEPEDLAEVAGAHLENPGEPVGEPADQYRLRYLQLRLEIFQLIRLKICRYYCVNQKHCSLNGWYLKHVYSEKVRWKRKGQTRFLLLM